MSDLQQVPVIYNPVIILNEDKYTEPANLMKHLISIVLILLIFSTFLDLFVTLTAFKYSPDMKDQELNELFANAYKSRDYRLFITVNAIFHLIPFLSLFAFKKYKKTLKRKYGVYTILLLFFAMYVSCGHVLGAFSWLFPLSENLQKLLIVLKFVF